MDLLILRHGKSSWSDPDLDDFDRPLKGRGKRDALAMGRYLAERDLEPDLILSSEARRATQTTKRVCRAMGLGKDRIRRQPPLYHAVPAVIMDVLMGCDPEAARVLLVGHNPGLEDLLRLLCPVVPDPADGKLLPTAALAYLRLEGTWSQIAPGRAVLLDLVRPRSLE